MQRQNNIVLCAGGTGGHLFPALAAGRMLLEKRKDVVITLATDKAEVEGMDNAFQHLHLGIPRRSTSLMLPFFGLALCLAFVKSFFTFLKSRPALVVGFGGYPSVPPVLAAQLLGIPTLLHEQNAYLGWANRILVGRSKMLALSFKDTQGIREGVNTILTGNPVRFKAIQAFQDPASPYHLFVVGGSQGAAHFSDLIPEAFEILSPEERLHFTLTMQCRQERLYKTTARFGNLGMSPLLAPFFKDMQAEFAKADFIISRAGASTVSEIATMGRCALFIPYPYATDDHQYHNAKALGSSCFLARQDSFTAKDLAHMLRKVNPSILVEKASAIHIYSMENASMSLAKVMEDLLPTV